MRNTTFIYTLSCPKSKEVRYIGKSNDPKGRSSDHNRMRDKNHLKNSWIGELLDEGLRPILDIIDEVLISEWKFKEKYYINKYREDGCKLLNICGGANGLNFGNETSFNGRNARKIVSLLKDGSYSKTFNSIKEAKEKYGSSINSVLHGWTKTAYGYIWIYEDEYIKLSLDKLESIVRNANNNMSNESWRLGLKYYQYKNGRISTNKKQVHQFNKDDIYIKTWDSASDASLYLFGNKKNQSKISMCINGQRKTAFGFKWTSD